MDLEYSTDGGQVWKPVATGVTNDGRHDWFVPDDPSANAMVRVIRHNLGSDTSPPFPAACSSDGSNAPFSINAATQVAGSLPEDPGGGLFLEKAAGGQLRLSWGESCSSDTDDHAVYEGTLWGLRDGSWDHLPLTCTAGIDLSEYVTPSPGDRFYLVAPLAGANEGAYGTSTSGAPRPVSAAACAPREADSSCP